MARGEYRARVDFKVLGPLAVSDNGSDLKLGGPKQRLILAMLLAAHGDTVSTDALMDGLWGDTAPATARKTLQGYVHHLRSEVGDTLVTDKAGYSLHLDAPRVDERRFTRDVDEARSVVDVDPSQASGMLTNALGLWRGNAYADLDGELVLRPEITRLDELRVVALGDRIDADLALGRHETLIGELESLTVEYPLRERFRAQHMLALYRSGRHGEALRAFARTRDLFVEEMGIEPSEQLTSLEDRILARDPSLDISVEQTAGLARAVRGYELREVIRSDGTGTLYRGYQRSVGREVAVRVAGPELADDPEFIARYEADSARVAKLNHPSIVYVQDTWREPGQVFQVMRWIEGSTLGDHVRSSRPTTSVALKLIGQIGDALDEAHRSGVVHGAVGPETVLVGSTGDAHLTDFVVGRSAGTDLGDRRDLARVAHLLLHGVPPCVDDGGYVTPADSELPAGLDAVFEAALTGEGYPRIDQFVRALRQQLGGDVVELAGGPAAPRTELRNPYKGLQAFQVADAEDFFGRDELVERIYRKLVERRLVAVVGPSGSGKSSLVKAGLAARIEASAEPMLVTEMYPGAYPFEELEAALRRVAVHHLLIGDQLLAGERGLTQVLKSVLPGEETELVLVIDQFEELFAMVASEETRALFLESLMAAVADVRSRLRVVLTMRADFFDGPLRYPEFGSLVEEGLVPVTVPDDAGLAAAIEGPAAAVGLDVEPGLVGHIVRDVSDQPGGLPLMQYALTELFDRRTSNSLTIDAYRATGGVVGALATRAEEIHDDLGPAGQTAMHQAFLRLVTVDEGADDVRRRVTRAELASLEVDQAALNEGLQRFGAHRLLTFDSDPVSRAPTVEVAHESLLREWERLREWVEEERDQLVYRKRLDGAMREWEDSGEDPAYLLGGGRLAQFDTWADTTQLALSTVERSFLEASREREALLARRSASRRRRVMAVLAVAAVVAASFGAYALVQREEVAQEAYDAETARLGNEAGFVSEWNRQLSLLMAVETFDRDPGFEGLSALQRVLVDAGAFLGVLGAEHDYRDVHWVSGDLLVGVTGSELHLLNAATGDLSVVAVDLGTAGVSSASSAGIAVVTDASGDLLLLDAATGALTGLPAGRSSTAAALSPDGTRLAVGYPDGTVSVFDRASGAEIASVSANPARAIEDVELPQLVRLDDRTSYEMEGVREIVFAPDGRRLVTAAGVFVRGWDAESLAPLGPEIVNSWGADDFNLLVQPAEDLWFDDSDPDVVVVVGDRFVTRWGLTTGERISLGTVPTGPGDTRGGTLGIRAANPGGEGRVLILSDAGLVIRPEIDELETNVSSVAAPEGFTFDTQRTLTRALTVDPDGERFAVASDGGVVVGALDGSRLLAESHAIGASVLPSLTRDGSTLAAGIANDGIHDLTTDPSTPIAFDVGVEIADVAGSPSVFQFAPAGHGDVLVWTSDFVGMTNAYDFGTGDLVANLRGSFVPAFSDDGSLVVRVAPGDRTRIDESTTGDPVHQRPGVVRSADFDSTGRRVVMTFAEEDPDTSRWRPTAALLIDIESGAEAALPNMPGGVFAAVFTPDEDRIVAIGGDGAVWELDADSLERTRELQDAGGHIDMTAFPPAFTSDGLWMFSASDGVARLWHLESGRQVGKPLPTEAGGMPFGVGDGATLRVVTPFEGNALIWNMVADTWVDIACRAAGRNMTSTEWDLFGPSDTDFRAICPYSAIQEDGA